MAQAMELIELHDDAAWDALVDASPQGTVFSRSAYLASLARPVRRYAIATGKQIHAVLAAPENADGTGIVNVEFTPYLGLLFQTDPKALPRQRALEEYRVAEFAVQALCERYASVAMSLSWHVTDIRPFLWHNYHEPQLGQFKTIPRYTGILDLTSGEDFPAQARACRRQELRKASAFEVREERDVEQFMHLYAQTFARQDIALPEATLALVRRITEAALEGGYGRLASVSTPQGIAAMTLFLFDTRRAYYLFAANDPAQRNSGAATRLMFENIEYARGRECTEFDFVGANSPNRGDFKLSFNPELKLYFDVRYTKGAAA